MSSRRGLSLQEIDNLLFNNDAENDLIFSASDTSESESDDDEFDNDVNRPNNNEGDNRPTGITTENNDNGDCVAKDNNDSDISSPVVKKRKLLTSKRIVNSLEKSLDENSYNLVDPPTVIENYECTLIKKTKKTEAKTVIWTTEKSQINAKYQKENILKTKPGLINDAKNANTCFEFWSLLITDELLGVIVTCTNRKINKILEKLIEMETEAYNYVKETNIEELKAYIGLLYARGLLQLSGQDVKLLFQDDIAHPIFGATMSYHRFIFLNSNITFDNIDDRKERFVSDRFAAVRYIFEYFNDKCSSLLQPDEYLTIDETLYSCRNQISFKQYNSSKPNKYGLLFKSINAVRYPFTFRMSVYSGKPIGEPTSHYNTGIMANVQSLVTKLGSHVDLKGRNITMDRLYTSYELFSWLLQQDITAVGTIMMNKRCVPNEIKNTKERESNSYKAFWDVNNTKFSLHSYVVKTKSKGMKNVLLLSTMPAIIGHTIDDGKAKPAVLKFYDFSKGGTDIVDQRIGSYTVNSKSKRWTMTVFSYILDTARINSQSLFFIKEGKDPRLSKGSFEIGWQLAVELVKPYIKTRKANNITLQKNTIQKMNLILNEKKEPIENDNLVLYPSIGETRKRCTNCIDNIKGKGFRQKVKNVTKIKTQCQKCSKSICNEHSIVSCFSCANKID